MGFSRGSAVVKGKCEPVSEYRVPPARNSDCLESPIEELR